MKRLEDWYALMLAARAHGLEQPYVFGRHDCYLHTMRLIAAQTGEDEGAQWAGKYKTPKGALRLLKRNGFDDFPAYLRSLMPEIAPLQACVGDVGIVMDGAGGEHLAICLGTVFETLTETGPARFPAGRVVAAYRVG